MPRTLDTNGYIRCLTRLVKHLKDKYGEDKSKEAVELSANLQIELTKLSAGL